MYEQAWFRAWLNLCFFGFSGSIEGKKGHNAGFRARVYHFSALLIVFSACSAAGRFADAPKDGCFSLSFRSAAEPCRRAGIAGACRKPQRKPGTHTADVSLQEETPSPSPRLSGGSVYVREVPEGVDVPERTPWTIHFHRRPFIGNS
jgi:hypothetical protein